MIPGHRQAPTRQNLLGTLRTLARVDQGADLLRRKREALVSELVRLARPAVLAQARILERARAAHRLLVDALAEEGEAGLRVRALPPRDLRVDLHPSQVWGMPATELRAVPIVRRTLGARGWGAAGLPVAAARTAAAYEDLTILLLDSAPRDLLLRRLAAALARTSRQVNTLERRVGPALRHEALRIRRALEEREREEHLRLARIGTGERGTFSGRNLRDSGTSHG